MSKSLLIEVTHANTGAKADIVRSKIFGWQYSEAQQCVLLYADSGAVFPVRESVEFLRKELGSLDIPKPAEPKIGTGSYELGYKIEYLIPDTNPIPLYTNPTNL